LIRHMNKNTLDTLLITANLPYVLTREVVWDLLYEPRMAFIGWEKTGFELYERFFHQLHTWKHRPKSCHIVIEFWLWQRDVAETILAQYPWKYTFFTDLRDIERFCHIIITS
jgi:methylase of polypeptide subunit release factors